ncbi:MAG: radical SAM protein [Verrucomicrobia bacterium]|nr:radical SAM protein [Verrucomicrobiota bacterium]
MRILLLMPDARMHKFRLGRRVWSLREAPLTLTTLAGLTAGEPDLDYQLVDGSVEDLPLEAVADLIGISVITGNAPRAYALADHFRMRGIPVVLGGVHVTLLPEEAAAHADAIVLGMAETTWPQVVRDARAGRLERIYQAPPPPDAVLHVPLPRRDLQAGRYAMPASAQATRGCNHRCEFCVVPAIWQKFYTRPVADVVRDIRAMPGRRFAFNDVSLLENREYALELFTALIPLRKEWGGLCTADIGKDPEMLELLARSGCRYLLIGFESLSEKGLLSIRKGFNHVDQYREVVGALHDHGISVQACFVLGLDGDTTAVFKETVDWVNAARIDIPRYSLYTAFPGTPLFRKLDAQGRILSYNWDDYDTMHVTVKPLLMSPAELHEGFRWTYRETFRVRGILRRMRGCSVNSLINLVGNGAYRLFVHRLYHDERFALPCRPSAPPPPPVSCPA